MKKIVAAMMGFSACYANAITNIESQRLAPPKEGISGNIELKLDGKSGNTDEEDYGVSGRLNHKQGNDLVFLIASKEYGTSNDQKDTDKSFAHGRWVHQLDDRLASEAFVQYQDNEFTRLLSRYLAGGGVRYSAYREPSLQLAYGAGAFYVHEKEDLSTYDTDDDYLRLNTYVSYNQKLNDNVNLVSTAYYQPRASDLDDYNILFNLALTTKLSEEMKLKLAVKVTHDSEPPKNELADPAIDVESTDTEYAVSFVYQF